MKKKIKETPKITLEESDNKDTAIEFLDKHFTKGQIFMDLCLQERISEFGTPYRITKQELLEEYWEDLIDMYICSGDIELDE